MAIASNPARPGGRLARIIGPFLCLILVVGLLARFVSTGRGGAERSAVAGAVPVAPSAVSEAAVALRDAIETGDPARYAAVEAALARAGEVPGASAIRAALLLSRHEFATARQVAGTALAKSPGDRALLGAAVDANVELGDYQAAQTDLQALLDLRPDGRALSRVSYLRELHGDMRGALTAMRQAEQAASESSEHATISTFLGDLCLAANDLLCAENAYKVAHQQRPNAVNPLLGQARLLAARHDLAGAVAIVTAVVDRSPQPAAASLLGELQRASGHQTEAADAFALVKANTQLLAAAGVVTDVEAALFAADHGDPVSAVALAEAAYHDRRTVFTADTLGWALTQAGRARDALAYVREAAALGTVSVSMYTHAAAAYAATGDEAGASAQLTLALNLNPWTAPALRTTATELAHRLQLDLPEWWQS